MAVAKSYEKFDLIGNPFEENGKMWIVVRGNCPRCDGTGSYSYNQVDGSRCYGCGGSGITRQKVRWYTDAQRASMDKQAEKRAEAAKVKAEERVRRNAPRNDFGFCEAGFITLFKGNQYEISKFFKEEAPHMARFNTIFNWFIGSKKEIPQLPESIEAITLKWDDVKIDDLYMKPEEEVRAIVERLIFPVSNSEYQGEVGDKLTISVTLTHIVKFAGYYGETKILTFTDENGNVYTWKTQVDKDLHEGEHYTVKGTVKEHTTYQGTRQTCLTRCRIA